MSEEARSKNPYACVSIQPGLQSCKAVWLLIGDRYLLDEAPSLPVDGCSLENCECRFNQHDDRREPGERRTDPSPTAHPDRRNAGRRHDDQ